MYSKEIFNLLTKEYTLFLVTTPQDFEAVKNIRKKVFSSKYSMPTEILNTNGLITNKEDKQSFIYLLKHNETNSFVGTVRVFFINTYTPLQILPLAKKITSKNILLYYPAAEISRLALINNLPQHKKISALQLRTLLANMLMVGTRINFFIYPSKNIFSIIEFSLYRLLKRQHVYFEQISTSIISYGIKKTPYSITRTKLLRDTENTMGKLTRHYLKELCQNPDSFWEFIDNNPYLERSDIQLDRICQLFKEHGDDVDLSLLLGDEENIEIPTV